MFLASRRWSISILIFGLILSLFSAGLTLTVHPLSHIGEASHEHRATTLLGYNGNAHLLYTAYAQNHNFESPAKLVATNLQDECDLCWLGHLLMGLPSFVGFLSLAFFIRAVQTAKHTRLFPSVRSQWALIRAPPVQTL